MTNISLPDGLTSIKNNTFGDCISLTSITIPNNVTSIDNVAFLIVVVLQILLFLII